MTETTVTIGDTEVQIAETEDGFEATPVEEGGSGLYIRAVSSGGGFGFEIPIEHVDRFEIDVYQVATTGTDNKHRVWWDTSVDVSNMANRGAGSPQRGGGFDGHATVETVEIVER